MIDKLKSVINNAYAPYSNYFVASILLTKDGNEFKGVNVENASFGGTICAERNAINNAVTNGYKKGDFKEIHIMVKNSKIGYPCFICRQTFTEFFEDDIKIYLYTYDGLLKEEDYSNIIVNPFDKNNL